MTARRPRDSGHPKLRIDEDESPPATNLNELSREAAHCRACPLCKNATQTVFGAGPSDAPIMLVGEQPGDQEDIEGRPFVGPAGKLLDRALADAASASGIPVQSPGRSSAAQARKRYAARVA
jgi:DNA polymerase